MADDVDLAQEAHDEFMADAMQSRKLARERELKNLPLCENYEDCGNKVVILPGGTKCRFCAPCLEEFRGK